MGLAVEGEQLASHDPRPAPGRWRGRLRRLSTRLRRIRMPQVVHRHGGKAAVVALALGGAWIALAVAGTTQGVVGPLVVDASVHPSWSGQSVVRVDPIGTVDIDSHRAPISLHLDVRAVDEAGIRAIVDDPSTITTLDDRLVDDLQGLILAAGIRGAVVATIGAALAAALALRSVRRTLLAGVVAFAGIGGSYGLAAATFDSDALSTPSYSGLFEAAPQLVANAEFAAANFDAYADQLAGFVTNIGALYDTTLTLPTFEAGDETIRVLHVSDLHLNPAAWGIIDAVATQYDVDAIVDTGDIADHGTPLENNYVRPISNLDQPYLFVKGNHDSVATAAAVAANPNAIVLENEVAEVAGLRFYGAPDPRFTPDQATRGTQDEDILRGSQEFAAEARGLDPTADVLLYHDPSYAEQFDGISPLVLSGHGHQRNTYVMEQGTRVMMQGSTGGAGMRALSGETPTPVMLSVLYFEPESKQLLAWDDITLGGLGLTTAQIERHQADEEGGEPLDPDDMPTPVDGATTDDEAPDGTPNDDNDGGADETDAPDPDDAPDGTQDDPAEDD